MRMPIQTWNFIGRPLELRRALQHEHHFDVEKWETRLGALLRPAEHPDAAEQDDLFDRKDRNG